MNDKNVKKEKIAKQKLLTWTTPDIIFGTQIG